MGQLLKSGQVGNIQVKQLAEQRKLVMDRWEQTGLLEGLDRKKSNMVAQLLENQAGYLLSEDASNHTGNIVECSVDCLLMILLVYSL